VTADSMSIGRQPQPVMVTVTGGEREDVEYWFRELDSSKRPFSLCIKNYTICVMSCGARSFAFIRAPCTHTPRHSLRPSRRRIKCSRRRQLPVIQQRTAN
jgi:hypothetical protein